VTARLQAQRQHERELKQQRLIIADYLCEECHTTGDWRGLSLSHTKPKGMGGTHHVYTIDEVQILCYPCHNLLRHHIREING
jgi:5-methylcytosine-specific restriction endonuclease McrA